MDVFWEAYSVALRESLFMNRVFECKLIDGFTSDFRPKPTIHCESRQSIAKPCLWPINTPVIHRAALNIKATRMKSATKPSSTTTICRPSVFTATLVHLHRPARFEKRRNPNLIFFTKNKKNERPSIQNLCFKLFGPLSWWRFHLGARPLFWISLKMLF